MTPTSSRRFAGIGLVIVLALVALLVVRAIRHSAVISEQSVIVSPDGKLQPIQGSTDFSVDLVQQKSPVTIAGSAPTSVTLDNNSPTTVLGWAVDTPKHALASKIYAVVNGSQWFDCQYGEDRPDVAKALGVPAYAKAGFSCVIPPNHLTSGSHSLAIAVVSAGGGNGFYSGYTHASLVVQ